jgi:hypothetical protein
MTKCPWCERYRRWYLKPEWYSGPDAAFTGELAEDEKERIATGFWACIEEIQDQEKMVAKLGVEAALKLGGRICIETKTGDTTISAFNMYLLASIRDEVFGSPLEHYWIQSGACSISFRTAICCESGNSSSDEESVEWEIREFRDLRKLTRKIAKHLEEQAS